jgi:hypothetical protein
MKLSSREKGRETQALLKILALGNRQIEEGRTHSVRTVVKGIRKRYGSKR